MKNCGFNIVRIFHCLEQKINIWNKYSCFNHMSFLLVLLFSRCYQPTPKPIQVFFVFPFLVVRRFLPISYLQYDFSFITFNFDGVFLSFAYRNVSCPDHRERDLATTSPTHSLPLLQEIATLPFVQTLRPSLPPPFTILGRI